MIDPICIPLWVVIDPAPTRTPIPTPDPRPDGAGGGAGVKNLISVGVGRGRNWKKIRKSGWGGAGTGKKFGNRGGALQISIYEDSYIGQP